MRVDSFEVAGPAAVLPFGYRSSGVHRGRGISDHAQEFTARQWVLAELAEHCRSDHADAGLVDAPRGHALMRRFDDDRDALWLEHLLDAVRDLRVHLLLHLQAARIGFDHTGQFRDADDL